MTPWYRHIVRFIVPIALAAAASMPTAVAADDLPITIIEEQVVMKSDNIDLLGTIPLVAPISANFHKKYMYVTGGGGLWTFDISNPRIPTQVDYVPLPHVENEDVDIGGGRLVISHDGGLGGTGALYIFDIKNNPANPELRKVLLVENTAANQLLGGRLNHTATCIRECQYVYLAGATLSNPVVAIVDLTNLDGPLIQEANIVDTFSPPTGPLGNHDVNVDSEGIAWVVGDEGVTGYDVTNPVEPVPVAQTEYLGGFQDYDYPNHDSLRPPGDILLGTKEEYSPGCESAGSFQTWEIKGGFIAQNPAVLRPLDTWITELRELTSRQGVSPATILCSAHWLDERDGLVAQAWYEQGTRILDVRDPRDIKQVGYFVMPRTETWATYWAPTDPSGEIVYSLDTARGIDVLHVKRPPIDSPPKRAPVRQQWLGDGTNTAQPSSEFSTKHPIYGWVCRIPRAALEE